MWPVFAQLCSMVAKRGDHWGTWAAAALLQSPCHDLLDLWHQRQRRNTLNFTNTETWHQAHHISPLLSATQMVWPCTMCHLLYQIYHKLHITGTEKKGRPRPTCFECGKTSSSSSSISLLSSHREIIRVQCTCRQIWEHIERKQSMTTNKWWWQMEQETLLVYRLLYSLNRIVWNVQTTGAKGA